MTKPKNAPAPAPTPAPAPQPGQGVTLNEQQVRQSIAAGLEILSGAEPAKLLQLADQLPACKLVMRGIASGELVVLRAVRPPSAPLSRKERRAAAAAARRASAPGK